MLLLTLLNHCQLLLCTATLSPSAAAATTTSATEKHPKH